jgi:hypothetical protein
MTNELEPIVTWGKSVHQLAECIQSDFWWSFSGDLDRVLRLPHQELPST